MPAQLGAGQQAQLVDLAQAVPGLKFYLLYAQADNCFGQALTDDQRAFWMQTLHRHWRRHSNI